jgi:ABC-type sugar transport system ATPase subunit
MCSPRLLYLDEFTESLDESAARRLNNLVRKLHKDGVTVVLVSHNIRIIRDFADIVVILIGGRITHSLAKDQITSDDDLSRYLEGVL